MHTLIKILCGDKMFTHFVITRLMVFGITLGNVCNFVERLQQSEPANRAMMPSMKKDRERRDPNISVSTLTYIQISR